MIAAEQENVSLWVRGRRRIPIPLRRNWKLLTGSLVVITVACTVFGGVGIHAYTTADATVSDQERVLENIEGTVDLFDPGVDHEIEITWNQQNYESALDDYFEDGEKSWFQADITIDGTLIEDVGVRLKGNSTLSSLTDARPGAETDAQNEQGGRNGGGMPDGGAMPDGAEVPEGESGGQGGGPGASLSTDAPEDLPLLVSFDEYQQGRVYQGRTEISIRPAGTTYSTAVNEALALEMIDDSGQASQDYNYVTYRVNGSSSQTRLVVEHPDHLYADRQSEETGSRGVLYKVLASSEFAYKGEDQTDYEDDFKQMNLVGSQDLQPVIDLLKWLEDASDEEFEDELEDWFDADSLAQYVATHDLLENFDSLSGPGHNGYLWYDLETGRFSIVSWDLNSSFGVLGGGGQRGQGGQEGEPELPEGMELPEGTELPEGMEMPEGMEPPGDGEMPEGGQGGAGGMMAGNTLITRFEENDVFAGLIEEARAGLAESWFDGSADEFLTAIADRIPETDGTTRSEIDEEVATLRDKLTELNDSAQQRG